MLASDRILLVDPDDIAPRRSSVAAPGAKRLFAEARWAALNVRRQIVRQGQQPAGSNGQKVAIPAECVPGMTLFAVAGSACADAIVQAAAKHKPGEPLPTPALAALDDPTRLAPTPRELGLSVPDNHGVGAALADTALLAEIGLPASKLNGAQGGCAERVRRFGGWGGLEGRGGVGMD